MADRERIFAMINEIRLAEIEELDLIYEFYRVVCTVLENEKYTPLWQIDNYPCIENIENHINNKDLYIAIFDYKIIGAMAIANHNDYSSLHLLTVHPDYRKQHLAESMVKKLFQIASERKNQKIILDVVKGNLPAEKLYRKFGFKLIGEKCEFIDRIGNVCFNTYEYILGKK